MCSVTILLLILSPQSFPDITVPKSVLWCCPAWIRPHQPKILCWTTTIFNKSSNLTYIFWIKLTTIYLEALCWNHRLTICVWGISFTIYPDFITSSWCSPNSFQPLQSTIFFVINKLLNKGKRKYFHHFLTTPNSYLILILPNVHFTNICTKKNTENFQLSCNTFKADSGSKRITREMCYTPTLWHDWILT